MANLKVFVSSTCYDLSVVRSQLRNFLTSVGYEPVMSDYADVLFDPRQHTHTSCVQEVNNCDVIVLIIGSRYGGTAVPSALDSVDINALKEMSKAKNFASDKNKLSVTQLEVLRAVEANIPIFTFIESGVMNDHLTYEKNKNKDILAHLEFPHIEKQETAIYVFEFINYLRLRTQNNSISSFSKLEDIELHLRKQWAALFQRLLSEQKTKAVEEVRIDFLTNQIADLKAAIVTSIASSDLKETAKGAIKFRLLVDFVFGLTTVDSTQNAREVLRSDRTWEQILSVFKIKEITADEDSRVRMNRRAVLIREDGTYFRTFLSLVALNNLVVRWDEFRQLGDGVKDAIITAVIDVSEARPSIIRHHNELYSNSQDGTADSEEVKAELESSNIL